MAGVEKADSWSTDAHKWLNAGYDCGFVAVRDPEAHRSAMAATAAYLLRSDQRESWEYVFDSSRRARGFALYAAIRSLGRDGIREMVERCCRLARRMADQLAEGGVEILNDVVLNQVLARFGDDARTQAVIARVQADGTAWMGGTSWHGRAPCASASATGRPRRPTPMHRSRPSCARPACAAASSMVNRRDGAVHPGQACGAAVTAASLSTVAAAALYAGHLLDARMLPDGADPSHASCDSWSDAARSPLPDTGRNDLRCRLIRLAVACRLSAGLLRDGGDPARFGRPLARREVSDRTQRSAAAPPCPLRHPRRHRCAEAPGAGPHPWIEARGRGWRRKATLPGHDSAWAPGPLTVIGEV